MGETTAISWTDHTFNPWWGCARVSPGCQNCYAEAFAKRTGNAVWGKEAERRTFGEAHWREPLKWNRKAEEARRPALVFCASMADVFEDRGDLSPERQRLWDLIGQTPWLEWQLLTKRPENVLDMVPGYWALGRWPGNVWVGTTIEDQQRAVERLDLLLSIPAAIRFVSAEPLLGPVRLGVASGIGWRLPEWVICGGESGPGHRPLSVDHARLLRDECAELGIPFLFKQHGGHRPTSGGDLLDGVQHKAFPARARR